MSTILSWVVYCAAISAVLALGALAWESAMRHAGRPARWGWLAAMVGAVVLPWAARLIPARAIPDIPVVRPVLVLDPLVVGYATSGSATDYRLIGLAGWAAISLLMLAWMVTLLVRLHRARRSWVPAELDGQQVLVSRRTGPAALGVLRGTVVLPEWALTLERSLRTLLLQHEREHVRAGDPRLVLVAMLLVAAMPWNPLMWVMALRLRNAIELDCDARVLRGGADPRSYGSLLLEVGHRRGGSALVMATFAEPRMFLENRIRRIARWPHRRRPMLAGVLAIAAVACLVSTLSARELLQKVEEEIAPVPVPMAQQYYEADALAPSPQPEGAPLAQPEGAPLPQSASLPTPMVSDTPPPMGELRVKPVFTPMTKRPELRNLAETQRALVRNYPPVLRDAGISGMPVVWFLIDTEGAVDRVLIRTSSGYPALDEAALAVGEVMKFTPARNGDEVVPVWVEIPVQFRAAARRDTTARAEVARRAAAEQAVRESTVRESAVRESAVREKVAVAASRGADTMHVVLAPTTAAAKRAVEVERLQAVTVEGERLRAVAAPTGSSREAVELRATEARALASRANAAMARGENIEVPAEGFNPYTRAPELLNSEAVSRALVDNYPPLLRDAGIGGTPKIWVLIDTEGRVVRTQLSTSSGYRPLDEAALDVAKIMRFSPARDGQKPVQTWVELPVEFRSK